jgi:hypothetical protein
LARKRRSGWSKSCVKQLGWRRSGWCVFFFPVLVPLEADLRAPSQLQDDDGAPFDPLLTPLAHFAPTWAALQTLPFLRRLRTSYGPNVILNLQSFPALEDVDMGMYYVDRAKDGVIPSGVKKLRLEYVCGFEGQQIEDETSWFKPNLFGSLTHLILVDMTTETCAYLERAVKVRSNFHCLLVFPFFTTLQSPSFLSRDLR